MVYLLLSFIPGFVIGLLLSFACCNFYRKKKLQRECLRANVRLYHELLLKKNNRDYQYSPEVRKAINHVHAALLLIKKPPM